MTNGLSLYIIEDGLAEILEARELTKLDIQRLEHANTLEKPPQQIDEDLAEAREGLRVIDKTLAEYLTLETRKVDNYHRFLTTAQALLLEIREEEKRFAGRRRRLETAVAFLKERAIAAMNQAGKKRIDGTNGRYLQRVGNGGQAPLVIDGWDSEKEKWIRGFEDSILDDALVDVTVTMPVDVWNRLIADLPWSYVRAWKQVCVPSNSRIREALAEPCEAVTNGMRCTAGFLPAGSANDGATPTPTRCPSCDGTGKQVVAGARLAARGERLDVR